MTEILVVIGLLAVVLAAGLRSSSTSATPGPLLVLLLIAGSAWYVLA